MMEIDSSLISRSLVQSLIAIAEHTADEFRRVCLDTLRELGMFSSLEERERDRVEWGMIQTAQLLFFCCLRCKFCQCS